MISSSTIEQKLQEGIRSRVKLFPDGDNRFRVYTPFVYDDGDHLGIVLKRDDKGWLLSDEGSTYMRLTLKVDEETLFDPDGNRYRLLLNALSSFEIEDREGELAIEVEGEDYGSALYKLVQGLIKVSDINYLSRERVASTFIEDFQDLIAEVVPAERYKFNWYDNKLDPKKVYPVDCKINGMRKPLFVYALQNDQKVRTATISIYKFREWNIPFQPIGIFEDQGHINNRSLEMFMNVCEVLYPNINSNKQRISNYLKEKIV